MVSASVYLLLNPSGEVTNFCGTPSFSAIPVTVFPPPWTRMVEVRRVTVSRSERAASPKASPITLSPTLITTVMNGHYGCIPTTSRPAFSSKPDMMLKHCTAAPAAPLVRLSSAANNTNLCACESISNPMSQ